MSLHRGAFLGERSLYAEELLHTDLFAHISFDTQTCLHRSFYTSNLWHKQAFTRRTLATKGLSDAAKAILPKFLPFDLHFVRKGCIWSFNNCNFTPVLKGSRSCYLDEAKKLNLAAVLWEKPFAGAVGNMKTRTKKRLGHLGTVGPCWPYGRCQKELSIHFTGGMSQLLGWRIWSFTWEMTGGGKKCPSISKCEKKHSTKQDLHISLDTQFFQICFHGWNSHWLWVIALE